MKVFPKFILQTITDIEAWNNNPRNKRLPVKFKQTIGATTIGQIVISGQFKYGFYQLNTHPHKNKIIECSFFRGDFTACDHAFVDKRTKIISKSNNQTKYYEIEEDYTPRNSFPMINNSSILCITQTPDLTEEQTLTLKDVIKLNNANSQYIFQKDTYLIPIDGDVIINDINCTEKQWIIVSNDKTLNIRSNTDVLLAVFK